MEIIEPKLSRVVPLFRALHNYHVGLANDRYHSDGTDAEYLKHLEEKCAKGGRVFAHDAGWGLVSYVLVLPEVTERDALCCARRAVRIDHLYVSPSARKMGLSAQLIDVVENWARDLGFEGWTVSYHAANPGVDNVYSALGATPDVIFSSKGVS